MKTRQPDRGMGYKNLKSDSQRDMQGNQTDRDLGAQCGTVIVEYRTVEKSLGAWLPFSGWAEDCLSRDD